MKRLLTILSILFSVSAFAQTSSYPLHPKVAWDRGLSMHKITGRNVTIDTFYYYRFGVDTFEVDFKNGFRFAHDGIRPGSDMKNQINRFFKRPRVKSVQAIADTMQVITATGTIDCQNAVMKADGSIILKVDTIRNLIVDAPGNIQIFDSSAVLINVRGIDGKLWLNWSGAHPSRGDNSPYWKKAITSDSVIVALYPSETDYQFTQPIIFSDKVFVDFTKTKLRYSGTGTAITVGPTVSSALNRPIYKFGNVTRSQSDWSDSTNITSIGINFRNGTAATFYADYIYGFTCNLRTVGTNGQGFAYSHIHVKHLSNGYYNLWTDVEGTGWNNSNTIYGTRVSITSGTHAGKTAYGWVIGKPGGDYQNNANVWKDADFEMQTGRIPIRIYQGIKNRLIAKRDEGNGTLVGIVEGDAQYNEISFLYHHVNAYIIDTSKYGSTIFKTGMRETRGGGDSYKVFEWSADGKAHQYDDTRNYLTGVGYFNSSGVLQDSILNTSMQIYPKFVQITNTGGVGVILTLPPEQNSNRVFIMKSMGENFRPAVTAYDERDSILPGTQVYRIRMANGTSTWNTSAGGIWIPGSNLTVDFQFRIPPEARKIKVMLARFGTNCKVYGFSIHAIAPTDKFIGVVVGRSGIKQIPLASKMPNARGSYEKGYMIYNANPGTGAALGWACSIPGTFGNLASATGTVGSNSAKLIVSGISTDTVYAGEYISVGANRFRIERVEGDTLFLNGNPGSYSGSINYAPPTFVEIGGGSAAPDLSGIEAGLALQSRRTDTLKTDLTAVSNAVEAAKNDAVNNHVVFHWSAYRNSHPHNGATTGALTGADLFNSSGQKFYGLVALVSFPEYVQYASNAAAVGVDKINTANNKTFNIKHEFEPGYIGRVVITMYDSARRPLGAGVNFVSTNGSFTHQTSYGTGWRRTSSTANDVDITVPEACKWIRVQFVYVDQVVRLRSFTISVKSPSKYGVQEIVGQYSTNKIVTAVPTSQGTFETGDLLWSPESSDQFGFICSDAGTMRTITGVTGTVQNSTNKLVVNDPSNLHVGEYIYVNGGGGSRQIIGKFGDTIYTNSVMNFSYTGNIVNKPATFKQIKASSSGTEPGAYSGSTSVPLVSGSFQRAGLSGDVSAAQNSNTVTVTGIHGTSVPSLSDGFLRYNASSDTWVFETPSGSTYTGSTSITLNGSAFQRAALTGDATASANSNSVTVTGIRNKAVPTLTTGFLKYDGTNWVFETPSGSTYTGSTSITLSGSAFQRAALTGDVSAAANSNSVTVAGIRGVAIPSLSVGYLRYNGSDWVFETPTNSTYTGSTSITLSGSSFQRAALTGDATAAANSNTVTVTAIRNKTIPTLTTGFLKYDGTNWVFETPSAGTGEANTASNYGVGGVGLYHDKSGTTLRFRNINAGSNKVTVALDNANREIDIDVNPANFTNIPQSAIVGLSSALALKANTADLPELVPGANISFATSGNTLIINASGGSANDGFYVPNIPIEIPAVSYKQADTVYWSKVGSTWDLAGSVTLTTASGSTHQVLQFQLPDGTKFERVQQLNGSGTATNTLNNDRVPVEVNAGWLGNNGYVKLAFNCEALTTYRIHFICKYRAKVAD